MSGKIHQNGQSRLQQYLTSGHSAMLSSLRFESYLALPIFHLNWRRFGAPCFEHRRQPADLRQHCFPKSQKTETFHLSLALLTYSVTMILSFGSKETERIWNGDRVRKLPLETQTVGRRKLRMLNNSQNLADLRIPPSNRLEKLSGNFKSFYSIRINKQWRIIFKWVNGNSSEVEIIDYH